MTPGQRRNQIRTKQERAAWLDAQVGRWLTKLTGALTRLRKFRTEYKRLLKAILRLQEEQADYYAERRSRRKAGLPDAPPAEDDGGGMRPGYDTGDPGT